MNISLEVKELGDPLEQYGIKRSFTIRMCVGMWFCAFVAAVFIALAAMIATQPDSDGTVSILVEVFLLCAVAAAILSAFIVWYMAGRRIAVHGHGIHARTRLGSKVIRWEDLDGIRTDITEAGYTHSPSYSTGSSSNSLIEVLLEIIFAIAASSLLERYATTKTREHYRLYAGGEEVLKIGTNYKNVLELVLSLEEHITEAHVPRLLERWQQGEIVEVAHFSFEPELIRRLGVTANWVDIREITSYGGKVTCILKGGERVDLSAPSAGEVNQHMVIPLMKAVRKASQA